MARRRRTIPPLPLCSSRFSCYSDLFRAMLLFPDHRNFSVSLDLVVGEPYSTMLSPTSLHRIFCLVTFPPLLRRLKLSPARSCPHNQPLTFVKLLNHCPMPFATPANFLPLSELPATTLPLAYPGDPIRLGFSFFALRFVISFSGWLLEEPWSLWFPMSSADEDSTTNTYHDLLLQQRLALLCMVLGEPWSVWLIFCTAVEDPATTTCSNQSRWIIWVMPDITADDLVCFSASSASMTEMHRRSHSYSLLTALVSKTTMDNQMRPPFDATVSSECGKWYFLASHHCQSPRFTPQAPKIAQVEACASICLYSSKSEICLKKLHRSMRSITSPGYLRRNLANLVVDGPTSTPQSSYTILRWYSRFPYWFASIPQLPATTNPTPSFSTSPYSRHTNITIPSIEKSLGFPILGPSFLGPLLSLFSPYVEFVAQPPAYCTLHQTLVSTLGGLPTGPDQILSYWAPIQSIYCVVWASMVWALPLPIPPIWRDFCLV